MEKKDLIKIIEIEYDNDCFWRSVALSTSREGVQFRFQNPQIDFHHCRFSCPLYIGETCCNNYLPLSQKLNLIPMLQ
jgi:hypothetical protein